MEDWDNIYRHNIAMISDIFRDQADEKYEHLNIPFSKEIDSLSRIWWL